MLGVRGVYGRAGNAYCNTLAYTIANPHSNVHGYTDLDGHRNTDPDPVGHAHPDPYRHTDADPNSDPDQDCDTDADPSPGPSTVDGL